jgi:hypothetical protein
MSPHLEAVLLLSIILIAADRLPNFNLEPICREVAGRAYAPDYREICLRREHEARDQLRQKWTTFPASVRSYCTELASLGRVPSYVELLTCLDLEQAASRLREAEARNRAKREAP